MELWQKIKAAKEEVEATYPKESHQASWEERDMAIFAAMVQAVMLDATVNSVPKLRED